MLKYLKTNYQTLLLVAVLFALGTLCFLLSGEDFIRMFSYLAAAYLFISGLALIVLAIRYHEHLQDGSFFDRSIGYFTYGLFLFGCAALIILFPEYLVRVFVGIVLLIIPAVSLILSTDKKRYLQYNFWKFIVGVIFIVAADAVIGILFDFLGIALIATGIFLLVLLFRNYRNKEYPNLFSKYIIYFIKKRNKE